MALLALVLVPTAGVAASNSSASQPVTQTYGTTGTLQQGMIVRLDGKDASNVVALEADRASDMHGIVVGANDAALSLASDVSSRQVYVATYGRYQVLVSDQNGAIKTGDYISISALNGVGMKADSDEPVVLGTAAQSFSGSGQVVGTANLKDSTGKSREVSLGRITVDMSISHNPLQVQAASSGVTGRLQNVARGLVGKTVSAVRLYISIIIMLAAGAVSCSMLYAGVKSSISSIGRNPLAKTSIMRSLAQVVVTSIMIFVIGLIAVYLLLKL